MTKAQTRAQRLQLALAELTTGTPDVTGAAVVSDDGLIISSVLPATAEEDSVGGMSSILLNLGTRVASDLHLGHVDRVMINGEDGNVLMVGAGDGALLMTMMTPKAKLGLIFLDVKRTAQTVAATL